MATVGVRVLTIALNDHNECLTVLIPLVKRHVTVVTPLCTLSAVRLSENEHQTPPSEGVKLRQLNSVGMIGVRCRSV